MARFITFEGLDGSGKSTQLRRAAHWLAELGVDVCSTHEPGGTPLGEAIREVFLGRRWERPVDPRAEALLVFASRRQHLEDVIDPALAAGRHVLCDRFTDSSLAYQGAGRGLTRAWVEQLDLLVTGGRRPDHTILFDLSAEDALGRRCSPSRESSPEGLDRFDAEDLAFHRRVRAAYLDLASREPQRFHRIDSSGDKETTWQALEGVLRSLLRP